jgi:hypothetical protein
MEEMPSQTMPVQKLKIAVLPLGLPCSRLVTHPGVFLATGKPHKKRPEGLSRQDDSEITETAKELNITPVLGKI